MGIALNLSPLYISELAPADKRGRLVTINQLLIMFGVLLAQVANWQISLLDTQLSDQAGFEEIAQSWNGQVGWRWMFGAELIPAALFFVLKGSRVDAKMTRGECAAGWQDYRERTALMEQAQATGVWNAKQNGLCKNYCPVTDCPFNGG